MEYQHGGDIYSREILWDFSANINPLGPPQSVKEAIRQSVKCCAAYPDNECRRLVQALSAYHDCPKEDILCGNGAADIIWLLAAAIRPEYAIIPAPTFSEYERALAAARSRIIHVYASEEAVPGEDISEKASLGEGVSEEASLGAEPFSVHASPLMEAAMLQECLLDKENGRKPQGMIVLCNPNNPTGLVMEREEVVCLAEFAEKRNIVLLLDECFMDFLDCPKAYSMLSLRHQFPHLVILKAFTKLYGMAGLRLGYCLTGNHLLLEQIRQQRQPWSVSTPAQMAGLAALSENGYVERTRKIIARGREQLFRGLKALGFQVWPGRTNYLFFRDMCAEAERQYLYQFCLEKKLLLRCCGNYPGLDGSYYRVCIKTKEENEHLLVVLKEYLLVSDKTGHAVR